MAEVGDSRDSVMAARDALATMSAQLAETSRVLDATARELAGAPSREEAVEGRVAAMLLAAQVDALRELVARHAPALERLARRPSAAARVAAPGEAPLPASLADVGRAVGSVLMFLAWGDASISYDEHGLMKRIIAMMFDRPDTAEARDAALAILSTTRANGDLPLEDIAILRHCLGPGRRSSFCEYARKMLATNGGVSEIEEIRLQAVEAMLVHRPSSTP